MNIAVIFAGGIGTRMNSKDTPKQFLEVHNKPIIIHTLEIFEANDNIDAIVISCLKDWIPYLEKLIYKYRIDKVKKVTVGGETGQLSIYNGLCAAKEISTSDKDIVLIHDGVRPLINGQVINNNINSVIERGSAITSASLKETIIIKDDDDSIKYVPNRTDACVAKAPQSFYLKDVLSTHERAQKDGITNFIDTCTMMQHYGKTMYLIDGPYENIKITTIDDYYSMKAILEAKENAQLNAFEG